MSVWLTRDNGQVSIVDVLTVRYTQALRVSSMTSNTSKEKILLEAARLIHTQGIGATSISDLQEATGLTRSSLYFHFPNKHALCRQVLERAREWFRSMLDDTISPEKSMGGMPELFQAFLELNRENEYVGGCIFGNTALETSDSDESFAGLVEDVFDEWQEELEHALAAAQRRGEVRSDMEAGALATHIVATIEGAIMLARLKKEEEPFRACIEGLETFLAAEEGETQPGPTE